MTRPNLDATNHWLVESLARFTFSIEYQKGWDNMAIDALNRVTLKLDAESIKSILDGITVGMMERADIQDLVMAEDDAEIHKPAQEMAILTWAACVHLHVAAWVTVQ